MVLANARSWRYQRLQAYAARLGAGAIVTAHHADDQAESVLANIRRGCGPVGLAGIAVVQRQLGTVPVYRPWLSISVSTLAAVAAVMNISWREDSTNTDQRWQRNWLRASVLPTLEHGVPGIAATLAARALQRQVNARNDETFWQRDGWQISWSTVPSVQSDRWQDWRQLAMVLHCEPSRNLFAAWDDLIFGDSGRSLRWGAVHFSRVAAGIVWSPLPPEQHQSLSQGLSLGFHWSECGGWRWRGIAVAGEFRVSAAKPGERWQATVATAAGGPRRRAVRRELVAAGIPELWRDVWPVVRTQNRDIVAIPCVGPSLWRQQLQLDCEWLGSQLHPAFTVPVG